MNKAQIEARRKGGRATKAKYGFVRCDCGFLHRSSDFYAQNGANGGKKTFETYGSEHMSALGKMGGRGNKGGKHDSQTTGDNNNQTDREREGNPRQDDRGQHNLERLRLVAGAGR